MGNIVEYYDRHHGYVCHRCFSDYAIKEFIKTNSVSDKSCQFCNSRIQAAALNDVFNFFMESLQIDWDHPGNCMGWDGREGGWQGGTVYDGDEVINDFYFDCFKNEKALDYFADALREEEFCHSNPYGETQEEILKYGWQAFCKQVKHSTRFLFNDYRQEDSYHSVEEIPAADFLKALGKELQTLNLHYKLSKRTKIFRARIHKKKLKFNAAKDLGTCPHEHCKASNRMSPAGIGMFYGAFSVETALEETLDPTDIENKISTIAEFKVLSTLNLLNLTEDALLKMPSVFDLERRHLRPTIQFLKEFIKDLIKPIERDGREHYDYVPTQIVTEFIKFFPLYNEPTHGLLYSSSKTGEKVCVLFIDNDQCVENKSDKNGILILKNSRRKSLAKFKRRE